MEGQSGEKSKEEKLEDVIALADSVISQKYLSFLTNHQVYQLKSIGSNGRSLQPEKHLRMFHLRKFIYDPEEGFLSKLVTVINVAYSLGGSIITSIQGKGDYVDVYIGVAAKENKGIQGDSDREALLNAFEGTVWRNFVMELTAKPFALCPWCLLRETVIWIMLQIMCRELRILWTR